MLESSARLQSLADGLLRQIKPTKLEVGSKWNRGREVIYLRPKIDVKYVTGPHGCLAEDIMYILESMVQDNKGQNIEKIALDWQVFSSTWGFQTINSKNIKQVYILVGRVVWRHIRAIAQSIRNIWESEIAYTQNQEA